MNGDDSILIITFLLRHENSLKMHKYVPHEMKCMSVWLILT